ncbi:protein kinase domain-containing protein [Novipirellula sp. SH528]|uniref:serine/threonine protein kinase n=1 Tax=Novipirellula sp. SH528 TaxID=3454466 RepID=UPI003F9FD285
MTVALSEFWARLVRNGVTDAAGCKRFAVGYADKSGGLPPADSVSLAKFLVKSGELTQYQAKSLLVSEVVNLRQGRYLQTDAAAAAPLSRWLPVVRQEVEGGSVNERSSGREGVLFCPSPEQLGGGRDQWVATHAGVDQPTLQSIEVDSVEDRVVIFSSLPSGGVLSEALKKRPKLKAKRVCEIGIAVCDALTALHAGSLWHGDVRADRVWVGNDGSIRLLRDPSGPAVSPTMANPYSWLDLLESPTAYAAPELADPATPCSAATDIYSLGCLICRLVIGKMPFEAATAEEMMSLHASQIPKPLAEAVAAGEAGDPLLRVVAFALAKNPQSRFANITQFGDALRATATMIESAAPTVAKTDEPPQQQKAPSPPIAPPVTTQTPDIQVAPEKPPVSPPAAPQSSGTTQKAPAIATSGDVKAKKSIRGDKREAKAVETPIPSASVKPVPTKPASPESASPDPAPPQSDASAAVTPEPVASEVTAQSIVVSTSDTASSGTAKETAAPPLPPPESESPPPPKRRRRKKKSNKAPLILGGLSVAVLMLVIMLLVGGPGKSTTVVKKRERPPIPARIPSVSGGGGDSQTAPSKRPPTPADTMGYQVVEDDRLLWLPPFAAEDPAPLVMLPLGPSMVMTVNLASLRANPSGSGFLDSLAPDIAGLLDQSAARAKVAVEKMDRLSIAMHKGKDGWPEVSLAVTLSEPVALDTLTKAWDVSASRTPDGATLYAGDEVGSDAYFVGDVESADNKVSRFSVSSIARAKEVAENGGATILLPRSMQMLWDATSSETDFAVIATPNFLFADARNLLDMGAPRLVSPLKTFLIPDVAAAMFLADFDDSRIYTEVRLSPSGGIGEATLMQNLKQAIEAMPQWAKNFVLDAVPDSSWRLLANQLPAMMDFVSSYSRYGVADQAAIGNAYLPADAASQITLATLFAINTTGNAGASVAATPSKKTFTLDELLAEKMSVSFDQESLEFGINIIAEQFAASLPDGTEVPPMRIVGGDLQKMGITQNQQIRGFTKKDMPFRQVLTDLLLGANPDKTATGSHDVKQALIWVVADDPNRAGKKELLITTRQAAEGKYELPAEFVVTP